MNTQERILLNASLLWTFSEGMLGPLFAVFSETVGGGVLEISWAWALFLIVSGVGISIVGKVCDKMNKVAVLLFGLGTLTIFTFGYLLVSSPVHLLIVQVGLGVGLAFAVPPWYALYDRCSGDGNQDGFVWGLAQGGWHVVRGVAILVGGLVVYYLSFGTLFVVMGTFMLAATLYQTRLLVHTP